MSSEQLDEREKIELVLDPGTSETTMGTTLLSTTETHVSSKVDEIVGQTIGGHYEVLGLVGEGGMGRVYKATHLLLDRTVAVKVLLPHLVTRAETINRFRQEGQAAIGLQHENICGVQELGVHEQYPFLVMEFLEGKSLSEILKEAGVLSQERAIEIISQVLDALEHAHKNKVIHRDIKPSNVVLVKNKSGQDCVKLVDFGIAKVLRDEESGTDLTKTGEVFGTPKYMSPEQISGKRIDSRSDIYSIGCVLYEMLTGRAPFEGESALSVAFKHVNEKPAEIDNVHADRWLKQVIYKALEKDPEDRYQSVSEMKEDLQRRLSPVPASKSVVWRPDERPLTPFRVFWLVILITTIIVLFNIVKTMDSASSNMKNGNSLFAVGQFESAARDYTIASQNQRYAPEAYLQLARIKVTQRDINGALWEVNKAIKLDPEYAHAYSIRGDIQNKRGEKVEASNDLNRAIELYSKKLERDEKNPYTLANRGLSYTRDRQYDKAIADFDMAIKLLPALDTNYNDRGNARLLSGDFSGAISDFSKAIELNPENVYAYRDRSYAREKVGDSSGAKSDMDMAERLYPFVNQINMPPMIREPGKKFIGGWIDPGEGGSKAPQ